MIDYIGASMEVNVDMAIRDEIRVKIQAGDISHTTFDKADKHCLNLLRYAVYPLWKSSNAFKEMLKANQVRDLVDFKESRGDNLKTAKAQLEAQISPMEVEDV